jgi:hypothetical protein
MEQIVITGKIITNSKYVYLMKSRKNTVIEKLSPLP